MSKKELIWSSKRDGYPLITKDELCGVDFDFLIVSSGKFYLEIEKEAMDMGIPRERIIKGQVFTLPFFDYRRYISLVKNPVTILSNDCWGGIFIMPWGCLSPRP